MRLESHSPTQTVDNAGITYGREQGINMSLCVVVLLSAISILMILEIRVKGQYVHVPNIDPKMFNSKFNSLEHLDAVQDAPY